MSANDLPTVSTKSAISWLVKGWQDFLRAPLIGLFFGGAFAVMGLALYVIFQRSAGITLALSAGFLLVGPFLAIGLYAVSRGLEQGQSVSFGQALTAWDKNAGALVPYLVVLVILEMLWARSAMVIIAVSFSTQSADTSILDLLLNPENFGFVLTYLVVGAVFAGLIFATSVVSIPMMMDRDTDGITAGITSIRVCLRNPLAMFAWGALIAVLTVLAMLPYFLGLFVIAPVIGHASWHAYRATVP